MRKKFANSRPLGREFVMFLRFFFLALGHFFPQLVRNIMVTDYFFVYSDFFLMKMNSILNKFTNAYKATEEQRGHASMAKYFVGGFEGTL